VHEKSELWLQLTCSHLKSLEQTDVHGLPTRRKHREQRYKVFMQELNKKHEGPFTASSQASMHHTYPNLQNLLSHLATLDYEASVCVLIWTRAGKELDEKLHCCKHRLQEQLEANCEEQLRIPINIYIIYILKVMSWLFAMLDIHLLTWRFWRKTAMRSSATTIAQDHLLGKWGQNTIKIVEVFLAATAKNQQLTVYC